MATVATASIRNDRSDRNSTTSVNSFTITPAKRLSKYQNIVIKMQAADSNLVLLDKKTFVRNIPSVFGGATLITWLVENQGFETRNEAILLGQKLFLAGFIFPLNYGMIKDSDDFLLRFQTPFYWSTVNSKPSDFDYAVYLCKKRLKFQEFNDQEDEEIGDLQVSLADRWDYIVLQAQEQLKQMKDKSSSQKQVFESQERAFWWINRPPLEKEEMDREIAALEDEAIDIIILNANLWARSLQDLLTCGGIELYSEFLASEFSKENLLFWQECEKFRQLKFDKKEDHILAAKDVFAQYLSANAPQEVNIAAAMRDAIAKKIKNKKVDNTLFGAAQVAVYDLMNKDSYYRYVRSEEYKLLKARSETMKILI